MMLAEDDEKKRDDRSNDFLNPVGNARNAIAKLTGQTLFMQKRLAFGWSWGNGRVQQPTAISSVSSETCHLTNPNVLVIVGGLLTRKSEQADTDEEDNAAYKRMSLGKLWGWMPTVPLLKVSRPVSEMFPNDMQRSTNSTDQGQDMRDCKHSCSPTLSIHGCKVNADLSICVMFGLLAAWFGAMQTCNKWWYYMVRYGNIQCAMNCCSLKMLLKKLTIGEITLFWYRVLVHQTSSTVGCDFFFKMYGTHSFARDSRVQTLTGNDHHCFPLVQCPMDGL